MSQAKVWFITSPMNDIPVDGSVQLGNVIEDRELPDYAVNAEDAPKIDQISTQKAGPWLFELSNERSIGGGINADLLAPFGIGAALARHHAKDHSLKVEGRTIETFTFRLTDDYVQQVLNLESVKEKVRQRGIWSRLRPLYIIDGIKIASGSRVTYTQGTTHGGDASLTVDLGVLAGGPPIQVGPRAEAENQRRIGYSFDDADPFVFAYRLQKIKFHSRGRVTKERQTGGLFSLDDEPNGEDMALDFDIEDVSPSDVIGYECAGQYEDDVDGGLCEVVLIK